MRYFTFLLFFVFSWNVSATGWLKSLENAQKIAIATDKLILVDFWASWCGPCKRMDSESWRDPEVKKLLNNYVPVKIDIDRSKHIASKYGVRGIPYIFIIDGNGEVVFKNIGYIDKNEVMEVLKNYALNTSFFRKEAFDFFEHQNYVTSIRLAEKYLDFSLYLNEEIRNNFVDLADEYLKKGEKFLDRDQSNYRLIDQKIKLLQLTADLYKGNMGRLRRNLDDFEVEDIDKRNKKLFAFLQFCLAKEENNLTETEKWKKIFASENKVAESEYQDRIELLYGSQSDQ